MKKIILAFLITGVMNAQQCPKKLQQKNKDYYAFVSTGFDVRNLAIGSKPTNDKSALDVQFKIGARANVLEISMFYESFNRINFQSYGVNVNGVMQLYKNFDLALGVEFGSVIREGNSNFLMVGTNSEIRLDLGKFIVSLQLNNRYRGDLIKYGNNLPIVNSGFFNIYYKLN